MVEQLTLVGTNSKYYGQIKNPPKHSKRYMIN